MELISDPSLLLLDEPTSGLDSFRATTICKYLNKLARQGKTIISTIHQPNSEAFHYFDKLILMMDGHIVFQGRANICPQYFKKIGYPLPKLGNPADHFMKILSLSYPLTKADEEKL